MKTHKPSISARKGFTIVELLVVIAVIGLMASIAVNEISDINGAANNAKGMRNAQNMASIFQSASAAGLDFYDPDLATIVANIAAGGTVNDPSSPFHGTTFTMEVMSADEQVAAQTYLVLDTVGRSVMYDSQAIP